jgi:hypothetical protein
MTLVLNGTNGLSDVDGSAATPAIRGTDANTGIFFPAADTIAFSEGGAEVMRLDSSGNLLVGTSATSALSGYTVIGQFKNSIGIVSGTADEYSGALLRQSSSSNSISLEADPANLRANSFLGFGVDGSERMRIDSSGNLLVGLTSNGAAGAKFTIYATTGQEVLLTGTSGTCIKFTNSQALGGAITIASGGGTAYGTSSDYRLKHDIQPMTGALAKVAQLNPVTYKWNVDESESQGFIAHELQAVIPDAVVGEKDAVDADGNPQYQNVDTSFLVATLTKAIQELKALVDTQASTITTLTDRITALEAK